ncbi:hypothetical protein SMICM304S_05869 [Streptomyces microflavus]
MSARLTNPRPGLRVRPVRRAGGLRATALAALLVPALSACGGDASSATGNATLKWASSYFPAHWDPVVSGSGAQFRQLALVYASLTRTDDEGKAVPDLAESWEYNDKGDRITFKLRPGQKFSDGEPIDAAAVKAAIERAQKQKNSALFGDLTSIGKVEANGLEATLNLTQIDYQIPQLLGQRVLQIASPKAAENPKKLDQNPVGAGPFVVEQLVPGTKAVLKKNPDYWDAENIHIDNVELVSAPDASTVVSGLRTGVYNFADIDPSQADAAKKAGRRWWSRARWSSPVNLNINLVLARRDAGLRAGGRDHGARRSRTLRPDGSPSSSSPRSRSSRSSARGSLPRTPWPPATNALAAVSGTHWLGTDYLGRDVFSRLLDGSRISVLGSLEVALVALVVGAVPGILSVYLGRAFEWFTLRIADTLVALPFLLFAIAVIALLGNGLTQAMLVTGVLVSPLFYRVSRAATLAVARSPYVEAAIVSGASVGWIVRRHVWTKVLPPIAVALAQTIGVGFVIVSSLTFLGIGVQPPEPTWGGLLASDLGYLSHRPWAPVAPALLIMVTVWACNLLADAIRDVSGEAGRALANDRKARANRREAAAGPHPAGGSR